jgi:hypothetical protein
VNMSGPGRRRAARERDDAIERRWWCECDLGRCSIPLEKPHCVTLGSHQRQFRRQLRNMFYKNYFVILSNATKAIRSAVATKVVKSQCRQKGRMSLATRDDALLPRGENVHQVILATGLTRRTDQTRTIPLEFDGDSR